MIVIINNKEEHLPDGITVSELIKYKGYKGKTSIWVNDRHLLLSEYDTFVIHENDILKKVTIVAGG